MTLDEYKNLLSLVVDPDKQGQAVLDIQSALAEDLAKIDSLNNKVSELKTSNDTLRDTNSKLVLKVTETVPTIDEPEEEPKDPLQALLDELKGE